MLARRLQIADAVRQPRLQARDAHADLHPRPQLLGVDRLDHVVVCPGVEAVVTDHKDGTVVTLVNWTNAPLKGLPVSVRLSAAPGSARSVSGQKEVPVKYADGVVTFNVDLEEADYILLPRGK